MRALNGLAVFFVLLGLPSVTVAAVISDEDFDAIGRTVYAESGSFMGRLAVVETIMNRLHDGRFGSTVQAVISQPHAFEPVTRAGGWRNLPQLSNEQKRDFAEMLWLHEQNVVTIAKGATFFQNEKIVADRAARGIVRKEFVGFNGMPKVAEYGGHTFYKPSGDAKPTPKPVVRNTRSVNMLVFGGE